MKIQYNSRHNRVGAVQGDLELSAQRQPFWAVQHGYRSISSNPCSALNGILYLVSGKLWVYSFRPRVNSAAQRLGALESLLTQPVGHAH